MFLLPHLRGIMAADIRWLAGWMWLMGALYALTWPTHVLIADEVAYLYDALQLLGRSAVCTSAQWSGYPPGVALTAAIFVGLTGRLEAAFGVGGFFGLLNIGALALLLRRWQRPVVWALYPTLFVPGLLLMRTLMSDVPSSALASAFLCAYAAYGHRCWGAFSAGLCAGVAALFRETNLLWALPFLVGAFGRPTQRAGWLWVGFSVGLAARLLWAKVCFGHFTYVRDPGVSFSLTHLPKNLAFFTLMLTVLCPGGLFFLKHSKMPFWPETLVAVVAMLLLYGTYGYDALAKSGPLKGLVLQGRFVLPLLPFLSFAGAFCDHVAVQRLLQQGIAWLSVGLFTAVQIAGWIYNCQQQALTEALVNLPTSEHWTLSYDESRKYLNALHTTACLRSLHEDNLPHGTFYLHLFTRDNSDDWHKKNAMNTAVLKQLQKRRRLTPVFDQALLDGTRLRIWRAEAATEK